MSDETLLELAEHIAMRRGNDVVETKVAFGELTRHPIPSPAALEVGITRQG